jgi:uncharacterized membrane protein
VCDGERWPAVGKRVGTEGETLVATLSVLKFDDPGGADRVLIALQGLQERQMITLEDAAVVRWPADAKNPRPTSFTAPLAGAPPGARSGAFCSG